MPRRRRNPEDELPYDEWIPTHAVMFGADGTVSLMTEPSASNPRRRRNYSKVPFDESTDAVMIKQSGYPVWIEGQHPVNAALGTWEGRVISQTHPDYELGDPILFHASEVRDTE